MVVNNNAGFLCWPLALGPPLAVGKSDAPIRWPPAVVPTNWAPQHLSRHVWLSVDGLAVALGWLWALLQRHPCSRRHATPCARMELPWLPRLLDRQNKTISVLVRLVVLFRLTSYWPSESEHRPNACVSTAFTYMCVNEMLNLQQLPLLLH